MIRILLVLAGVLPLLAACAVGPAQIPVSGVTGPNGGATETIYYDQYGHAHFQS